MGSMNRLVRKAFGRLAFPTSLEVDLFSAVNNAVCYIGCVGGLTDNGQIMGSGNTWENRHSELFEHGDPVWEVRRLALIRA